MTTRVKKRQRAHHQRPSSSWALEEEEDHLLHMDPSLMTERQQMAFLLRTTAHEASDASQSSDESSEEEAATFPRPVKTPRRIQRGNSAEHQTAATTPTRRGRGRPPKHRKISRPADIKLRVTTQKDMAQGESKVSPSGSDDIAHLDAAARSFGQRTPRCALCCDYDTAYEASYSDALFLCPACDRKYPTQQELGQRACVT